jgi:hypothetical protein
VTITRPLRKDHHAGSQAPLRCNITLAFLLIEIERIEPVRHFSHEPRFVCLFLSFKSTACVVSERLGEWITAWISIEQPINQAITHSHTLSLNQSFTDSVDHAWCHNRILRHQRQHDLCFGTNWWPSGLVADLAGDTSPRLSICWCLFLCLFLFLTLLFDVLWIWTIEGIYINQTINHSNTLRVSLLTKHLLSRLRLATSSTT